MPLPLDQLGARALQWDVTIQQTWETPLSMLAFGVRGGAGVVLKISKQVGDEWLAGEILRAFSGHGAVRVYESEPGAILLERLEPGEQLAELVRRGQDEEATEILAQVMHQMARHKAPEHCPTVWDWARGFDRYLNTSDKAIPRPLVDEAHKLYQQLAASAPATMLQHGDLQHYNVLFDSKRGWVAIDPKGVVGELEYEVGAILRNPVEQPELFASTATIERRLDCLTGMLELSHDRALAWAFAQAVLSAIWDIEDGYPVESDHPALRLALTIKQLVRL
ncbi:MAG: aminoglycoside phosphotransferase family protein [Pyrinomonadaceae bacterium]